MPRVAEMLDVKAFEKAYRDAVERLSKADAPTTIRIAVGGTPPGLLLQVMPNGSASWILRRTINGKRRMLGLGAYKTVTPPKSRPSSELLADMVAMIDGETADTPAPTIRKTLSLSTARNEARAVLLGAGARKSDPKRKTFRDAATALIEKERPGWRNPKHAAQWTSTLEKWVYPKIGDTAIADITTDHVESILVQPVKGSGGTLWANRHETATRVRQRIESVLDHATARKWRSGDNPARWRGNLSELMPAVSDEDKAVTHHAALPYVDAPAFMAALRERNGTAARALAFTILTAARSGEVRAATWEEMDLDRTEWVIPAGRMKAKRAHTVPLSDAALAILTATPEAERTGLVFPGAKAGKPLSDMTLAAVLKRMDRADITVHGFRSTFREWAGETTGHPREVIEHALAHSLPDAAEAAYQRGTLLPKRVRLMADWAGYLCDHTGANVVPMRGTA